MYSPTCPAGWLIDPQAPLGPEVFARIVPAGVKLYGQLGDIQRIDRQICSSLFCSSSSTVVSTDMRRKCGSPQRCYLFGSLCKHDSCMSRPNYVCFLLCLKLHHTQQENCPDRTDRQNHPQRGSQTLGYHGTWDVKHKSNQNYRLQW